MELRRLHHDEGAAVAAMVGRVFTASAGETEGRLVGGLAADLLGSAAGDDVQGYVAVAGGRIIGALFFSRLTFDTPVDVRILAPVAVDTEHQRQGVGRALIAYGLREMARQGVSFVVTYGDSAQYAKSGFRSLSPDAVEPPHALSQPVGWLGQSLTGDSAAPVLGGCRCVKALDNPVYW